MGMTDSQFKAFICFVLDSLQEVKKEKDPAAHEERLNKVIDTCKRPWRTDIVERRGASPPFLIVRNFKDSILGEVLETLGVQGLPCFVFPLVSLTSRKYS